jgi:hypothetical protein
MGKVYEDKIENLTPDSHNANKGNERGLYLLEKSVESVGVGRSIVIDKNNRVVAGNKTLETLSDLGIDDVLIVETDGKQLVAVKRTDWNLEEIDGDARRYAYLDNRASQVGFELDVEVFSQDLASGVDFSDMFSEKEIGKILEALDVDALDLEDEQPEEDQNTQKCFCPKCGYEFSVQINK